MEELLAAIRTKEAFDAYWDSKLVSIEYEDVKDAYEGFVEEMEKDIFLSDYKNCISREDFIENLHADAQFAFQDALTEVFYDKNPELYELAFAFYEEAQTEGYTDRIAVTFHDYFNQLYQDFLNRIFDRYYAN